MRGDNVIKDSAMNASFQQGLAEGLAGLEIEWIVVVSFEGTDIYSSRSTSAAHAIEVAKQYVETAGSKVTIEARYVKTTPDAHEPKAVDSGSDDDVVDAEIVG